MKNDITGQKFGKLTAIKRLYYTGNYRYKWLFRCECGRELIIDRNSAYTGNTKSCGCIRWNSFNDLELFKINQIIKEQYGIIPINKIAKQLKIPPNIVVKFAKKLGLKTKLHLEHRKYTINENFFEIPNLLNSYWAGFIAADGYVSARNALGIDLALADIEQLEKFKKDIEFTGPISVFNRNKNEHSKLPKCRLIVYSGHKKLTNDLEKNFNVVKNKTLILRPPDLMDSELIKAFIIGYIDGDGSIGINEKERCKSSVQIVSTLAVCEWIKSFFESEYQINNIKIHKKDNIYSYRICGKSCYDILNDLIKINTPKMFRKWDKAKKILEQRNEEKECWTLKRA